MVSEKCLCVRRARLTGEEDKRRRFLRLWLRGSCFSLTVAIMEGRVAAIHSAGRAQVRRIPPLLAMRFFTPTLRRQRTPVHRLQKLGFDERGVRARKDVRAGFLGEEAGDGATTESQARAIVRSLSFLSFFLGQVGLVRIAVSNTEMLAYARSPSPRQTGTSAMGAFFSPFPSAHGRTIFS